MIAKKIIYIGLAGVLFLSIVSVVFAQGKKERNVIRSATN